MQCCVSENIAIANIICWLVYLVKLAYSKKSDTE